jgi:hypothetical protein
MSLVEELLFSSGGIDEEGRLRSPREFWRLLDDAPSFTLTAAGSGAPAAVLRLLPDGAGALQHDISDDTYWLLSPSELDVLFGRSDPEVGSETPL